MIAVRPELGKEAALGSLAIHIAVFRTAEYAEYAEESRGEVAAYFADFGVEMVDRRSMSLIDGIISLSAAETMSKVQTAIAAKVLKVANAQGEAALQLLDSAMQNSQDAMEAVNNISSDGLDTYA